jgi:hypothetical protein
MLQEYRVRRQFETWTFATMISRPSTPMMLGGQDQFLKVSIYTVDKEHFSGFLQLFRCPFSFLTTNVKILSKFCRSNRDHIVMRYFVPTRSH